MATGVVLDEKAQNIIKYYLPTHNVSMDLADFFSIFCDPTRIKILSALNVTEMCVTDLSSTVGLNQSTVSHQLKFLRSTGIVRTRRDGKIIYYSVSTKCIKEVIALGRTYIGL